MSTETLENHVTNFLNFDSNINDLVSQASKVNTEQFLCDQLMKSFKLLSNAANSEVTNP